MKPQATPRPIVDDPQSYVFDVRKLNRAIPMEDDPNIILFVSDLGQMKSIKLDELQKGHSFQALYVHKWDDFFRGEMEITTEDLRTMKRNFDRKLLKIDLAIDYSHEAWGKAAGWVQDVELRNNDQELWYTVEWNPGGAKALLDKEFRYFSAEFAIKYKDENATEWGPTLIGGGLTNRPFLKRMSAILNSQAQNKKVKETRKMEEKTILLSTHDAEIQLRDTKIKELQEDNLKLATLSQDRETLAEEVKVKDQEIETLKMDAKNQVKQVKFDSLVKEGKADLSDKDVFMKLDLKDEEIVQLFDKRKVTNMVRTGQGVTPTGGEGGGTKPLPEGDKEVVDKYLKHYGVTEEDHRKANPELQK